MSATFSKMNVNNPVDSNLPSFHDRTGSENASSFESSKSLTASKRTLTLAEDVEAIPEISIHRPTGLKWVLIIVSILIGLFLFALNNTIVADIQPTIVEDFQAVDKVAWLATAFIIPGTALMLPAGQFFQVFNAKWCYILGILVFEVGSAVCGAAVNITVLIMGRAIAGIGSTAIYTGTLFLISVNTSERERPSYIGLTGAMWGLGTLLGPLIGGALSESRLGWRWAFYINLPIGGLIAPVLVFLIPSFDAQRGMPYRDRIKQIDWIGSTLLASTIVSLMLALAFGGNEFSWADGRIIGLFVLSGVLLMLFAFSQTLYFPYQTKERRMFPVEMLFMRTTVLLFILVATAGAFTFITLYYIPLYFQFTRGNTPFQAAVLLLPVICILVFGTVVGGILLTKFGVYSPFYLVGTSLGLIGSVLLHFSTIDASAVRICSYASLVGFGAGVYSQVGFTVAQAKVDKNRIGQAIGLLTTGQLIGAVTSLAISGTIFLNDATIKLTALLPGISAEVIKNAIAGTAGNFLESLDSETRQRVLEIIVSAIDKVFILGIVAGAVGLMCSLLLKHERIMESRAPELKNETLNI